MGQSASSRKRRAACVSIVRSRSAIRINTCRWRSRRNAPAVPLSRSPTASATRATRRASTRTPGRESPLPRRPTVHRAILPDRGARRRDRATALHHLRREAADSPAGARSETGRVGRGHYERSVRCRSLAVARGFRGQRDRVDDARGAHGRDDRDHPWRHHRGVHLVPGQARPDPGDPDLSGAEAADPDLDRWPR